MDKILAEIASTCSFKDDGCGKHDKNEKQLILVIVVIVILLCSCGGGRGNFIPGCNTCGAGGQSGGSWLWLILLGIFFIPGILSPNSGNVNTNLITLDTNDGYDEYYE